MTHTQVGPPPPFDPELAAGLAAMPELPPSITVEMVTMMREMGGMRDASDEDLRRGGKFDLSEHTAPGPEGAPDIKLLVLRPTGATTPRPAIFYIHGGGMVMGSNRGAEVTKAVDTAQELELVLVSVEYRLAPEHPHPAPVQDCYAGLLWTRENAAELGIDPDRIVIAGGSAGGGLAASTALMARDLNAPELAAQLLFCPMLDDRNDSYSAHQMVGLGVWDQAVNEMGWTALLGDRKGTDDVDSYGAAARATDLSGLPPTYIDVGSAETFRDEAVEYASRIWQAGGHAELHVWPGGFHGFEMLAPQAAISQHASGPRALWLRRVLGV
jgi:acetyl esterase/lipase